MEARLFELKNTIADICREIRRTPENKLAATLRLAELIDDSRKLLQSYHLDPKRETESLPRLECYDYDREPSLGAVPKLEEIYSLAKVPMSLFNLCINLGLRISVIVDEVIHAHAEQIQDDKPTVAYPFRTEITQYEYKTSGGYVFGKQKKNPNNDFWYYYMIIPCLQKIWFWTTNSDNDENTKKNGQYLEIESCRGPKKSIHLYYEDDGLEAKRTVTNNELRTLPILEEHPTTPADTESAL